MFILSCKQDVQGKKIYLVHIVYYTSYHIKMGLIYGRHGISFPHRYKIHAL